MKNSIIIIALMMISSFGISQEIKTIFASNELSPTSMGGFGGPLIRATQINNDWGLMIGGKGGAIINGKFAFGGIGMGLASNNRFTGDNLRDNENASLDLGFGGGGVFFEYIYKLESPVHFSIPIHVMAGGVSINENELEIESSGVFILEPGINLEFNLSKNVIPGIHFSYRQALGSDLINVSNEDLSGVVLGLVIKFGSFE